MNLKLLQLGDSALPVGGYSHSWGLEAAIERGAVRDAAGLERWARSWLRLSLAPFEGVVVAASCRAALAEDWRLVRHASALIAASLAPPTLRQASGDMGEQLLGWPSRGDGRRAVRRSSGGRWRSRGIMPLYSGCWRRRRGASREKRWRCFFTRRCSESLGRGAGDSDWAHAWPTSVGELARRCSGVGRPIPGAGPGDRGEQLSCLRDPLR